MSPIKRLVILGPNPRRYHLHSGPIGPKGSPIYRCVRGRALGSHARRFDAPRSAGLGGDGPGGGPLGHRNRSRCCGRHDRHLAPDLGARGFRGRRRPVRLRTTGYLLSGRDSHPGIGGASVRPGRASGGLPHSDGRWQPPFALRTDAGFLRRSNLRSALSQHPGRNHGPHLRAGDGPLADPPGVAFEQIGDDGHGLLEPVRLHRLTGGGESLPWWLRRCWATFPGLAGSC